VTVISVALFDVGSQPLARFGDGPAFKGFKPTDLLQQYGNLRRILSGQSSDLYSHGIRLHLPMEAITPNLVLWQLGL
jgi:hypothetical protein